MKRRIDPDDIVMTGDIADRLRVSRPTAQRWATRLDFPAPVAEIRAGLVYDYSEVLAWRRSQLASLPDNRAAYEAAGL